ncbi:hypothetical protein PUNSTDRAFT_119730 [Punctularia strigosozonata HHB-11173 SS5]|uniref:uncharacterized protein n=1 Tax=Punctularia strigosozonata (strain HHB-11173) TaxID=741275 RepID=UPI0004417B88|nr:uncharacterized protein PUNSTDRAFT_119730 [Punctularia strigosozonata HHB-11173 SS5]EIN10874.1 hypothetical protein PUNSTDRAFT_119730 [Punctularia strigosozonata HHB-11173 SS5]
MARGIAPEYPLPQVPLYSVEYPGYVTSVPSAISHLGGDGRLLSAFKRTTAKHDSILELNFRPGYPFSHPIPGDVGQCSNILLKITKRKRQRMNDLGQQGGRGEYTAEAVGVITKSSRFRSMADFQYAPNTDDPVAKLRAAMDHLEVDAIKTFRMPGEEEDYAVPVHSFPTIDPNLCHTEKDVAAKSLRSNMRLFPPPSWSRQQIPQLYNYKSNPASAVITSVNDETGEEKSRLINQMRWKGLGPTSISFSDADIPLHPPVTAEERRAQVNLHLLKRLEHLFEKRPIWSRTALMNQFTPSEAREIHNSKSMLPLVSYVFSGGPWRDTHVRFGYDPRKDPQARFYQRLYFRNVNHPIVRPSIVSRRQQRTTTEETGSGMPVDRDANRRSHIFDGVTLTQETAAFQLCDVEDDMLKELIESQDELRDLPDERDGWYTTRGFEQIKIVLRHKFFSLVDGHIASREECKALLVPAEGATKPTPAMHQRSKRLGRHNMAKGALPPEDAAALRLRATLDRKAKPQGQKTSK